ncbi:MAG: Hpt domain-containing protein, partial [Gemmatimonas sp.]
MDLAKYAELFRTESREHLAEIESALASLERDGDAAHIAVLFRSTHTIKGMAGSMGYVASEQLSHALETLLDAMRTGKRAIDGEAIGLLYDGSDALAAAVSDAAEGRGDVVSPTATAMLERLASAVESTDAPSLTPTSVSSFATPVAPSHTLEPIDIDNDVIFGASMLPQDLGNLELSDAVPAAKAAFAEKSIEVRLAPDAALKGVRAMIVLARIEAMGTVRAITPAQQSWNEDAFEGTFTVAVGTAKPDDEIEAAIRGAGDVARVTIRAAAAARGERESLRHVRIDLRRLD